MVTTSKMMAVMLLTVFFCACGYRMTGKATHLPPGITSIAIPTFSNETYEPGIEIRFTQAFLTDFLRDSRVKVLDRHQADSVLEGVIKSYLTRSVAYDQANLALEYQTTVVVDLVLKKRSGEILWKENRLTEMRWYRTPTGNVLLHEAARDKALQEIGGLMAERVRNRFFYNF